MKVKYSYLPEQFSNIDDLMVEIRELVKTGRPPRFLMPDSVCKIIDESNCYGQNDS